MQEAFEGSDLDSKFDESSNFNPFLKKLLKR